MSVIIDLTGHELEKCDILAKMRNTKKENVKSRRIDQNRSDYDIHFMGLLGEMAVAKYLGIGVDVNHNINGGDKGNDFIYQGKKVDVKYTDEIDNPLLVFNNLYRFKSTFAILTRPVEKHCRHRVLIEGWTDKHHFRELAFKKDFGYGNRCCLERQNLFNIEILKN